MNNALEINYSDISCGVLMLVGVNETDPEAFKMVIAGKDVVHAGDEEVFRKGYTYIFSDNFSGNGKKIASLIKRYNLGSLQSTGWRVNPSSRNRINIWTWRYSGAVPSAWNKLKRPYEPDTEEDPTEDSRVWW